VDKKEHNDVVSLPSLWKATCYNAGMHHDVYRQINLGIAMHEAYGAWTRAKHSGEDSDIVSNLYYDYVELLDLMNDYVPDPDAKF